MISWPWIQETDLLTNSCFSVSGKTLILSLDRFLRNFLPILRTIDYIHLKSLKLFEFLYTYNICKSGKRKCGALWILVFYVDGPRPTSLQKSFKEICQFVSINLNGYLSNSQESTKCLFVLSYKVKCLPKICIWKFDQNEQGNDLDK